MLYNLFKWNVTFYLGILCKNSQSSLSCQNSIKPLFNEIQPRLDILQKIYTDLHQVL